MALEILRGELIPPVIADAVSRSALQIPGQVSGSRVHEPYGDQFTNVSDGKREIAVIGDDDSSIDRAIQGIDEEMRGDVDV